MSRDRGHGHRTSHRKIKAQIAGARQDCPAAGKKKPVNDVIIEMDCKDRRMTFQGWD